MLCVRWKYSRPASLLVNSNSGVLWQSEEYSFYSMEILKMCCFKYWETVMIILNSVNCWTFHYSTGSQDWGIKTDNIIIRVSTMITMEGRLLKISTQSLIQKYFSWQNLRMLPCQGMSSFEFNNAGHGRSPYIFRCRDLLLF